VDRVSPRARAARAIVTVRSFARADGDAVAALWGTAFPDDRPWNAPRAVIARKRAQRDGLFWVATRAERVVGAVMAGWDGQRGWIYHLAVAAAERRRGVGRALVAAAERGLAERGCPKVNLQVLESNRDVVAFYERLGWRIENRVSMGKTLDAARAGSSAPRHPTAPPARRRRATPRDGAGGRRR
jgi:ribosomal protein S18 acetylase RimI-like enzyme